MKRLTHILFSISATVTFAVTSQAQISLLDSDAFTTGDDLGSHTFANSGSVFNGDGLDFTGADKLVVTVGGEGSGNNASDNTVTSVTYGGVGLTEVIQGGGGSARMTSIWYIDLAGQSFTGSDFFVDYVDSQDGLGFGAYLLSGTASGFSSSNSASGGGELTDSTMPLTTLTDGEFVVGAMARNNFDNAGTGGDGTGFSDPLQGLFYEDLGGSSAASGSFTAGTAGSYDLIINDAENSTATIVGASFAAVPEPSAFALLAGCFGLTWIMLRRRS